MKLDNTLTRFRSDFEVTLAIFLDSLQPSVERIGRSALAAFQGIREFSLQKGKRLRPFLMFLTYKGYGGQSHSEIMKACCSIELMQSFLLISDDVMDNSDLRRGSPTLHKRFQSGYEHLGSTNASHMGKSLAILASDIAMSYGAMAIARTQFPPERIVQALDFYFEIVADEGYGQLLDMEAETGTNLNEQDVLKIYQYKTTRYTIEGPMHLGAVLAGSGEQEPDTLSTFAAPAGNIYQLQDDILGLFGDEEKIGKPVDSDVKEGKQTLLIKRTLESATDSDLKKIQRALGDDNLTPGQLSEVQNIVRSCGALDYAKDKIEDWANECRTALSPSSLSSDAKQLLIEYVEYLTGREY